MKQVLIAADQLANTFVPPYSGDDKGWADETLSSRAWRMSAKSKGWARAQKVIDKIFWWLLREKDHCFESWMSENLRRHLPPEMRAKAPISG